MLDSKDMKLVSGGNLTREMDGSIVMYWEISKKKKKWVIYGTNFNLAVEDDWELFQNKYKTI